MSTPIDSALVRGTLMLPSTPGDGFIQTTESAPVVTVFTLLSVLIIMVLLRRIVEIFPSLMASIIRWKESINLNASVKLSRDRSLIAAAMVIPFCLIGSKAAIYSPSFMESLGRDARFGVFAGVFVLYVFIRIILEKILFPKKRNFVTYRCACRSSYSFFILLTLLLLLTSGLAHVFELDQDTTKDAMLWISTGIYSIFLLRKTQIFTSSYSIFTAFLYLCALEILPTGVLIASAVIL